LPLPTPEGSGFPKPFVFPGDQTPDKKSGGSVKSMSVLIGEKHTWRDQTRKGGGKFRQTITTAEKVASKLKRFALNTGNRKWKETFNTIGKENGRHRLVAEGTKTANSG